MSEYCSYLHEYREMKRAPVKLWRVCVYVKGRLP